MIKIKAFIALVLLISLLKPSETSAFTPPSTLNFSYGKSGQIVYDLKNGTFSILEKSRVLLKDGFSTIKQREQVLSSKDDVQRTYSKTKWKDQFGKGTRHMISLKSKGWPDWKQVFYTYDELPYFFCELEMEGANLHSNGMVPIHGVVSPVQQAKELNSLFVPFDNDTFISYDSRIVTPDIQQNSAEVGAWYDNESRGGLVTGSVTHEVWKTGVKTSTDKNNVISIQVMAGFTDKDLTRDAIAHGAIKGTHLKSPKIFFGAFADWRTGMEDFAKANRLAEPPVVAKWNQPTPVGWNSWGVMQDKISFDKVVKVVDFFADSLKGFRNENIAYVDLDSYWDMMLKGGLEGDYSRLKEFADYTKKKGLKPGVYWAPFTDWGFGAGGNRRAEGGNYKFGEMWTKVGTGYHDIDGARALDPTHPGTQQRIALVIGKLKACGFEMIKIDFLGHAAVESEHFYNPEVTTGMQAYRAGMEYLLKQLDGKMMVYAAISPSLASGKYVHVRRIACDAFKSIKDTKYSLNSLTYGWWQTYLYDYMDADHVVLGTESEGANKARMLSAVVTGTLIVGDDFSVHGQWQQRAKEYFQNPQILEILKDGKSFRPLDGNVGKGASAMFIKQVKGLSYLAVFNYGDKEKTLALDYNRLGLPSKESYDLKDLLTNDVQQLQNHTTVHLKAGSARIFKISKRVSNADHSQ